MQVVKRDGSREDISFDKITRRIATLAEDLSVDPTLVAQKTIQSVCDGIHTSQIDELSAELSAGMVIEHDPDYGLLAGRILVSNHEKNRCHTFAEVARMLYEARDEHGGAMPLVSQDLFELSQQHADEIEAQIDYKRDYVYDFFAVKTLFRSYLMKIRGALVERIQHMWMRVAIGIHGADLAKAFETYHLMSKKIFTHATPTLFHAGTPRPQMSSCYLMGMTDSVEGIFKTLSDCAQISKWAGGIGLHVHNIRAKGSQIRGTNGTSNGLVPMLKVFNHTARYIDQGGGRRKGSFAIYLEPWHADVFDFLYLKKNHGEEETIARDLFYAMWIPDLFMKRVEENGVWSLMCPYQCPGLSDAYGAAFDELYTRYESEGRFVKQIDAQKLWQAILEMQIESGTPYLLFKDAANRKSNQKNIGTIKSSNLCVEIIEYSDEKETAVCNLGSISLKAFVDANQRTFDFEELRRVTHVLARNLDRVIDLNFYPTPETARSNFRHRPIGIGVQGLADTFCLLRYPFDSPQARDLNRDIFETIYFAAVEASVELAKERGQLVQEIRTGQRDASSIFPEPSQQELARHHVFGAYPSYLDNGGCPASKGQLSFDLWDVTPSGRWDWATLKEKLAHYGMRNSLLVAPMPTASTAQILGNCESFEPFTSNLMVRRTLAGDFPVVNAYLVRDLIANGLWTPQLRERILVSQGSIQNLHEIPTDLREIYKTAWDLKMRTLLDMAADRAPFIDQSMSLNLFVQNPTIRKLTSMHFHAWKLGLKTGIYYLRTLPVSFGQQFAVDPKAIQAAKATTDKNNTEECLMCSA
jgi:ribonucleoside-diphosphate reductase alpha subunit